MEDNGYSVKDRGFILNIVYRSLLFRSSFCFFSSCHKEMMSMMVVVHRSVNETKTEHTDNEYAFH